LGLVVGLVGRHIHGWHTMRRRDKEGRPRGKCQSRLKF
jgi:hypothetical protein